MHNRTYAKLCPLNRQHSHAFYHNDRQPYPGRNASPVFSYHCVPYSGLQARQRHCVRALNAVTTRASAAKGVQFHDIETFVNNGGKVAFSLIVMRTSCSR